MNHSRNSSSQQQSQQALSHASAGGATSSLSGSSLCYSTFSSGNGLPYGLSPFSPGSGTNYPLSPTKWALPARHATPPASPGQTREVNRPRNRQGSPAPPIPPRPVNVGNTSTSPAPSRANEGNNRQCPPIPARPLPPRPTPKPRSTVNNNGKKKTESTRPKTPEEDYEGSNQPSHSGHSTSGENRTGQGSQFEVDKMREELIAIKDEKSCPVCLDEEKNTVFQCGHRTCATCSAVLEECPMCRERITQKIKTY